MSKPWAPTTVEVRARYVGGRDEEWSGPEFDRWLAAHDRETAAKALDAGGVSEDTTAEREAQFVEALCEVQHDAYEAAAMVAGWQTQERSRKPWAEVPEANKATMRASVRAVLAALPGLGWVRAEGVTPNAEVERLTRIAAMEAAQSVFAAMRTKAPDAMTEEK